MEDQDRYLQRVLEKELSVVSVDTDEQHNRYNIDLDTENPSNQLLDIQDLLLQKVPEGKTKSITVENGNSEIAHIDLSPLAAFKSDIEQLQEKIERLDQVEETIHKIDELTNTYKESKKIYEEKLGKIEDAINQKFGLIDNTINKQKGQESDIKPSTFKDINKKYSAEIKSYFKNTYKKLFQGKSEKGGVEQQSMNNAIYAKLRLKENLLKEFKNTRANANPDQMGEELLLSLIRPIKAVGNTLHQYSAEKKELSQKQSAALPNQQPKLNPVQNKVTKADFHIKVNGTAYEFKGYSKDYSKLFLQDISGNPIEKQNNKGTSLNFRTQPKLNPIQEDLLNKGKTLLMTDGKFPYKLSKDQNGHLDITTVSISEFTAGKKESQKNNKSIQRSI